MLIMGETTMFKRFMQDDTGATAVEYVLIGGAMAVSIAAIWPILVAALQGDATSIAAKLTSFQ